MKERGYGIRRTRDILIEKDQNKEKEKRESYEMTTSARSVTKRPTINEEEEEAMSSLSSEQRKRIESQKNKLFSHER